MKKITARKLAGQTSRLAARLARERAERNDLYRVRQLPGEKRRATRQLKLANARIEKLRHRLQETARAKVYVDAVSKFKPKKTQRGKYLFIDQKGRTTRRNVKGVFIRVTTTGKVRPVLAKKRDRRLYRRNTVSLVSRVKTRRAKLQARQIQGPQRVAITRGRENKGTLRRLKNPYSDLGRRVTQSVRQFLRNKRTLRTILVEIRLTIRHNGRLETHIIIVGLDISQAAAVKQGNLNLQKVLWKQVSEYLANLNLITVGSARRHVAQDNDEAIEDLDRVQVVNLDYVILEGGP